MTIYVKCQRGGRDSYAAYEGQSEETITALLTDLGATDIQFITAEEFAAAQQGDNP